MIIDGPDSVTKAVLSEIERAPDPRFREVMSALVRHLHAFIREVRLTEDEFRLAGEYINAIGKSTNDFHNEAVLMSGSLGVSTLVCLLNNGNNGATETTANLLGPFWRLDSPPTENGGSIIRSPTPGPELFVTATVKDRSGKPVADAEVDIWQSSTEGLYENQDPTQADMNLRGKLRTDAQGRMSFRSIKPAGYPIPINGPSATPARAGPPQHATGASALPDLQGGYKTHISQVYLPDDPNIETDVQFGVTKACSATTCARCEPPRRRGQGPVVFARLHVRDGARHGGAAAPADPGQGQDHRLPSAVPRGHAPRAGDGEVAGSAMSALLGGRVDVNFLSIWSSANY